MPRLGWSQVLACWAPSSWSCECEALSRDSSERIAVCPVEVSRCVDFPHTPWPVRTKKDGKLRFRSGRRSQAKADRPW